MEARVLYSKQRTGVPNYAWNMLASLKKVMPDIDLTLYASDRFSSERLHEFATFTFRHGTSPFGLKGSFWVQFIAPKLIRKDSLDVFLAPRTLYPTSLAGKVPIVCIVHDLNLFLNAEVMRRGTYLSHRLWLKRCLMNADVIAAVSSGTSVRMERLLGKSADYIVPPAVSGLYRRASAEDIASIRCRYYIRGPYIIFVGTLEPRKNLVALIRAHEKVNAYREEPLTLVLVGKRGWKNRSLAVQLDKGVPNVMELGYVAESELPALYSGASALVMPSLYEGYGMPAAEARACGTRIVATDIPELHESAGSDAIFIEPTVEGIERGINAALAAGLPPPHQPKSWDESARVLADALRAAASRKR